MQNILVVDNGGKISGVIDWECVSAPPLWKACQLPEILGGIIRSEEPQRYGQIVSRRWEVWHQNGLKNTRTVPIKQI